MSQQEERTADANNIPRGAIGHKGLIVGRTARLPSIRSPRDLTLGAQPKRTFMPNIPVRREKRTDLSITQSSPPVEKKAMTPRSDRGRGRGKSKPQIIQTAGAVFGEGIAMTSPLVKGKQRQPPTSSSGRSRNVKKEAEAVHEVSLEMKKLLRDDFVVDDENDSDDVDDDDDIRPVKFPLDEIKQEHKKEELDMDTDFKNKNVAEEMGYDIEKIAKFIKKEKGERTPVSQAVLSSIPKSDATDLFTSSDSGMFLLRFPTCLTAKSPEEQQNQVYAAEEEQSSEKNWQGAALSSLTEGRVGKVQILKSGRVRLVIGSLHYILDCCSSLTGLQEVASVDAGSESGNISILGAIKQKFSFFPDVSNILIT